MPNPFIAAGTLQYMLLCMKVGSLNRLENVDVSDVHDDEELFNRLRDAYAKHRGVGLFDISKSLRELGLKKMLVSVFKNLRSGNIRNPFKKAVGMKYIKASPGTTLHLSQSPILIPEV